MKTERVVMTVYGQEAVSVLPARLRRWFRGHPAASIPTAYGPERVIAERELSAEVEKGPKMSVLWRIGGPRAFTFRPRVETNVTRVALTTPKSWRAATGIVTISMTHFPVVIAPPNTLTINIIEKLAVFK